MLVTLVGTSAANAGLTRKVVARKRKEAAPIVRRVLFFTLHPLLCIFCARSIPRRRGLGVGCRVPAICLLPVTRQSPLVKVLLAKSRKAVYWTLVQYREVLRFLSNYSGGVRVPIPLFFIYKSRNSGTSETTC